MSLEINDGKRQQKTNIKSNTEFSCQNNNAESFIIGGGVVGMLSATSFLGGFDRTNLSDLHMASAIKMTRLLRKVKSPALKHVSLFALTAGTIVLGSCLGALGGYILHKCEESKNAKFSAIT